MPTTAPEAPASVKARSSLVISLQKAGVTDEDKQRHVCAVWARRPIGSRTELTEREARSLAARVKEMSREELAAVLARPAPEPVELDGAARTELTDVATAELPPGAIACRPGTLTEHDAAMVREFAEFLTTAGPAPTVEELDAVRQEEPDALPPIGAFRLTPDGPVQVDADELVRCVATWCEDDACTAEHPEPVDVEAAAEEAVRRFRERQAAGIVPEAPDLSSLPPREVIEMGPAPGRYCMDRCYCRTCPGWEEQRQEADATHAREVRRALFGIDQGASRRR